MAKRNVYTIYYSMDASLQDIRKVHVVSGSRAAAYDDAIDEILYFKEFALPHMARVHSVTYSNGVEHVFKM